MAEMTSSIVEYADNGNSRTWTVSPAHSAEFPVLVKQSRVTKSAQGQLIKDTIRIIQASRDSDGVRMEANHAIELTIARPIGALGGPAGFSYIQGVLEDIINSDNFQRVVDGQLWLDSPAPA